MGKPKPEQSSLLDDVISSARGAAGVGEDFLRSIGYSAVQAPVEGLTQLTNHVAGKELLPKVQIVNAPSRAEFGTVNWHLQQVGGAIGLVVPFGILNKGVKGVGGLAGRGARFAGLGGALSKPGMKAGLSVLEMGATGAAFEGLLRPVQPGEGDFWTARRNNALTGAATFSTLQAASMGLKGVSTWRHAKDSPWLINATVPDLTRHMVAGGVAGLMDAEARSLLSGKGHADLASLGQSAYGFMWVGGALRGSKFAVDSARGRSTIADIVAKDGNLQATVRQSPTAAGLLAALGDVRVERTSGEPGNAGRGVNVHETFVTGEQTIKINDSLFRNADPMLKTQLLVEGMAGIETARTMPLTWRHAFQESAYAGMMTSRAKTAAAREINFVKELEAARGEQSVQGARDRAVSHWSEVSELNGIDAKFRAEHQAKYGPWAERAASVPILRSLIARPVHPSVDKQHILSLAEFDQKMHDPNAREQYKIDMGPAKEAPTGGTARDTSRAQGQGNWAKNEKLDRVIDLIPEGAQVIVDMGAGGGQFTQAIKAQRPNAEVVALDLSGTMIGDLKGTRASGPVDFRVQHGDAMRPDFPANSVDVITGNSHTHEILSYPDVGKGHYRPEHLTEMFGNYAEMLKPGGRLLIQEFIVPKFGDYAGPFRVVFKTAEGRQYFQDFVGELSGQGTHNLPHVKPVPEYSRLGQSAEAPQGGVQGSAAATGEFLISSTYGMRMNKYGWPENVRGEYDGVLQEQFANLTADGMANTVRQTAPEGFRMDVLRQNTYTSPDYIEHWGKHFEVQVQKPDGSWSPIADMNNFHTRIVLGAEKAPANPSIDSLFANLPGFSRLRGPSMYFRVAPGALIPNQLPGSSPATRTADNQLQLPGERVDNDKDKNNFRRVKW